MKKYWRIRDDIFGAPGAPAEQLLLETGSPVPYGSSDAGSGLSGILFAKKKKRKVPGKATPKGPSAPKPASKAAPKTAPKAVRRKAPAPQAARKKKGASGAVRAENFFTGLSLRFAGEGYERKDFARLGLLGAGLLVILYYAFSAGGYFVSPRSYGELWILYLIVLGLLFGLQVKRGLSRLGLGGGRHFRRLHPTGTWLQLRWSFYPARSFDEFIRALLYLSGFGLFYLYLARREWLAWLGHLFVGIAVIVAIRALLGKVFPDISQSTPILSAPIASIIPSPTGIRWPCSWAWPSCSACGSSRTRASQLWTRMIYGPVLFLFWW